jgi:RNA polymerase sigma-70 factor (ECF subfamily)
VTGTTTVEAPAPVRVEAPPFRELFEQHAPYVWRVLRRLGVPARDVEDLSQEVFVVVHRKLPGFEGRSSLRTWLYAICLRTASDHRRRAHVRREHVTDRSPERACSAPQPAELERRQARAMLDAALDTLPEDKRAVFVLYEVEGLTMPEVAEAVGCPLQTAYSRLYSAREAVQAEMLRAASPGGPR